MCLLSGLEVPMLEGNGSRKNYEVFSIFSGNSELVCVLYPTKHLLSLRTASAMTWQYSQALLNGWALAVMFHI